MKNKLTVSIVVFLASASAQAMDLQQAESLALQKNTEIRMMQSEYEASSWERIKYQAEHLPHLDFNAKHTFYDKFMTLPFEGQAVPEATPYTIMTAQASWMFFDGLGTIRRWEAADLHHSAMGLRLEHKKKVLTSDVRLKFDQALGAQILSEVAKQNVETLEHHISDIASQVRGGVSTRFDSLRVEVQLEEAKTEQLSAEDNVVIARAKLWQVLDEKDDGQPLIGELPASWESVDLKLLARSPDRKDRQAQVMDIDSAKHMAQAEKSLWAPKLSVIAEKDWYNNTSYATAGSNSHFNDAYSLGLMMTWNLFDGGARYASYHEALEKSRQNELTLSRLDQDIPVEIEVWKRKFLHALASIKARQSAIRKSEESVRLARNGVKAGVRTHTEVLDAEMDLNQSRARVVAAQLEAVEALGQLETATGMELTPIDSAQHKSN